MLRPTLPGQIGDAVPPMAGGCVGPLNLVNLPALMKLSEGRPEITIGLIDGPVARDHPDLAGGRIREIPGAGASACVVNTSAACRHGTFVAGILAARRGCAAPAICPGCTLLVRPIFSEAAGPGGLPSASPQDLAEAIIACIDAGARVLNISAAITQPVARGERALKEALGEAARHGVIVVAAAGNQGSLGCTAITGDSWVIPVVAYEAADRPLGQSNLGASIGRNGIGAPGARITSLGAGGKPVTGGGKHRSLRPPANTPRPACGAAGASDEGLLRNCPRSVSATPAAAEAMSRTAFCAATGGAGGMGAFRRTATGSASRRARNSR
ncbi:MAG: S8 family serine peptidase [Acetobacteraceae bacterium]